MPPAPARQPRRRALAPLVALAAGLLAAAPAAAEVPVTLRGSPASMVRQHEVAKENDYTFLRTPAQVREFVRKERLVPLASGPAYRVNAGVSFPYVRPELRMFMERLGRQHRDACGERPVVTSATRPLSSQPRNAHALSVHPTGMALDLRVSREGGCRAWLEKTLLSLESQGVLDVTRERTPPHFHVAVFPGAYAAHVARLEGQDAADAAMAAAAVTPAPAAPEAPAAPAAPAPAAASPVALSAAAPALPDLPADDDDTAPAVALALLAMAALSTLHRRRELRRARESDAALAAFRAG